MCTYGVKHLSPARDGWHRAISRHLSTMRWKIDVGESQSSHTARAARPTRRASPAPRFEQLRDPIDVALRNSDAARLQSEPSGGTHWSETITGTRPSIIVSKRWNDAVPPPRGADHECRVADHPHIAVDGSGLDRSGVSTTGDWRFRRRVDDERVRIAKFDPTQPSDRAGARWSERSFCLSRIFAFASVWRATSPPESKVVSGLEPISRDSAPGSALAKRIL